MSNDDLFDKYFRGYLSAEEKLMFTYRLNFDSSFAIEFSIYKEIRRLMSGLSKRETLKDALKKVSEDYFKPANRYTIYDLVNFDNYNLN